MPETLFPIFLSFLNFKFAQFMQMLRENNLVNILEKMYLFLYNIQAY